MPFDMSPEDVETVTKPEVFSLEGLIAWLEKQNPATKYEWADCEVCCGGQYLKANGCDPYDYPRLLVAIYGRVPGRSLFFGVEQTFGDVLSRARALLAKP